MADNTRFFFRTEKIGNAEDAFVDVPEDLDWAVDPGQTKPVNRQAVGNRSDGGGATLGDTVDNIDGASEEFVPYTNIPNTKIKTPVIKGIVNQAVSQDPEGKGTIDVTFSIDEAGQTGVEWELRITR